MISTSREPLDVLLVEDNPGDVRLTREAFQEGRVETTLHVASDGVEALDVLHRRGDHADAPRPDVVLLDPGLPQKTGEEVLEEMRSDPDLAHIPVIVLTSTKEEERVERFYDLQANAYLVKPTEPDEFVDLVRSVEDFWFRFVRLPTRAT